MCALVSAMGLRAEAFSSAESFLDQIDTIKIGCLVSDFKMGEMNGLGLHEKLNAAGIALPTIILSAHVTGPIKQQMLQSGIVVVLEKPCCENELIDAIRQALGQGNEVR